MKFQNPSMHGSWRTDTRTHARTHARTHGQPETNMPRQLLRSWGHNDLVPRMRHTGALLLHAASAWQTRVASPTR